MSDGTDFLEFVHRIEKMDQHRDFLALVSAESLVAGRVEVARELAEESVKLNKEARRLVAERRLPNAAVAS